MRRSSAMSMHTVNASVAHILALSVMSSLLVCGSELLEVLKVVWRGGRHCRHFCFHRLPVVEMRREIPSLLLVLVLLTCRLGCLVDCLFVLQWRQMVQGGLFRWRVVLPFCAVFFINAGPCLG